MPLLPNAGSRPLVQRLLCSSLLCLFILLFSSASATAQLLWVVAATTATQDYTAALTFACSHRPELLSQVLHVLEDLLAGAGAGATASNSGASAGQNSQSTAAGTTTGADGLVPGAGGSGGGPASTHVGLCCAAIARSLVPLASLELASRRLLPGLMALMSYGEPDLQRACVGVMAELGIRFRDIGPRVSEQVLAVYDSLLEQGSHAVQEEVLAAGTALAVAAAPSAAVAAAAAAQVEWLLMAVQAVARRLTAASNPPSLEQQRALAAQLLAALRAVSPHDLRLPRLQVS